MALVSNDWRLAGGRRTSSAEGGSDPGRHLLMLRFALFNVVVTGMALAVVLQGWLADAFSGFTGWLCSGIAAVFGFGLALCGARIWRTSAELSALAAGHPGSVRRGRAYLEMLEQGGPERGLVAMQLLRLRLGAHNAIVLHTANSLVFLGLVGTVIGFIVALSGVDPAHAGQVDSVAPMISTLVQGMSIALYTTLIGALLHLWLLINYRMLASGTARLFNALVEHGERHVGA